MPSYGIIGDPVAQSLSPYLHMMLYQRTGYSGTYGRFPVKSADMPQVLPALRTLGISGVNVTSPHKQAIIPFLDGLSPEAEEIGAVNTVHIREDGFAKGYNTDCYGFAKSLLHAGIAISGKRFLLCGLSGAGRAARYALMEQGAAEVLVASTDAKKGIPYTSLSSLPEMDVIVNCTPLGMKGREYESPVDENILLKFGAAVDLTYNPAETLFLGLARKKGLRTLNGLPMLVFQGIKSFEYWTGIMPPDVFAEEILDGLACILMENRI